MEKILISSCLLGCSTRYDGKSKRAISEDNLARLMEKYELVPFCPEIYGGLPTPRVPSERVGDEYITKDGISVTENYLKGAREGRSLMRLLGIQRALLKAKSPACGKALIYDGSFSGTLTEGNGALAELLLCAGIAVYSEDEIEELL